MLLNPCLLIRILLCNRRNSCWNSREHFRHISASTSPQNLSLLKVSINIQSLHKHIEMANTICLKRRVGQEKDGKDKEERRHVCFTNPLVCTIVFLLLRLFRLLFLLSKVRKWGLRNKPRPRNWHSKKTFYETRGKFFDPMKREGTRHPDDLKQEHTRGRIQLCTATLTHDTWYQELRSGSKVLSPTLAHTWYLLQRPDVNFWIRKMSHKFQNYIVCDVFFSQDM